MKHPALKYSAILLIAPVLISCYSYAPIRIMKKVDLAPQRGAAPEMRNTVPAQKTGIEKQYHVIYVKKYFAEIRQASPSAGINNRAVLLSLNGRFREAEILFKDLIAAEHDFAAACNNLGVIYEVFGKKELAFAMYSRACILEPGNSRFQSNFRSFEDTAGK